VSTVRVSVRAWCCLAAQNPAYQKEGVTMFKNIQMYMGDAPVAVRIHCVCLHMCHRAANTACVCLSCMCLSRCASMLRRRASLRRRCTTRHSSSPRRARCVRLCVLWCDHTSDVCGCAVRDMFSDDVFIASQIPELRDEAYCQLCKQTNNNPNMCVVVVVRSCCCCGRGDHTRATQAEQHQGLGALRYVRVLVPAYQGAHVTRVLSCVRVHARMCLRCRHRITLHVRAGL
jgi:hypothetical protein